MAAVIFMAVLMAIFITLLYAALAVASKEDDLAEKVERPAPTVKETWVRYSVPLDDELQKYIERKCREYEVPSSVVIAIIGVESNFDPNAKGDMRNGFYQSFGLMQIWASEHTDRCKRLNAYNLLDPYQNVNVGIDFLAELINYYDGDWKQALTFYNGSEIYAERVIAYAECLAEGVMSFSE